MGFNLGSILGTVVGGAFGVPFLGGALGSAADKSQGDNRPSQVPFYKDPNFLGQAIGTLGSIYSAREANKTAIDLANTAHQREARDLERAGLNRILGYSKGGSGSAVPPIRQQFDANTALAMTQAFKTYQEGKFVESKTQSEIAKNEQDVLTGQAEMKLKATLARTNLTQRNKLRSEIEKNKATLENLRVQKDILTSQASSASSQATIDNIKRQEFEVREKLVNTTGLSLEVVDRILTVVGTVGVTGFLKHLSEIAKKSPKQTYPF